ncbi:MAG: ATPase [Pseudomonadota bacterium]
MNISSNEFRSLENKAITLLGMSGVGKTTLANKLDSTQWFHYSGDYRIGTKYLEEPILDNIKAKAMNVDFLADLLRSDSIYICSNITVNNLEPVSTFLGKVGNPELGGLELDEFKNRQNLHRQAETFAMLDVPDFISKAQNIYGYPNFLNDAGGSLCELTDPEVFEVLSDSTLILYIRANEKHEKLLCERAISYPKPLYFQEAFLDEHLQDFMESNNLDSVEDINPDQYSSWVFPKLLEHRKPLYESIAEKYGYTVDLEDIQNVRDQQDFVDLICNAIDK